MYSVGRHEFRPAASLACIAVLVSLTIQISATQTASSGEELDAVPIRVTVVGPSGVGIAEGKLIYHVEGPRTNRRLWLKGVLPVTPVDIMHRQNHPERVMLKVANVAGGKVDLLIPKCADKLWVEVHHARQEVGASDLLEAKLQGPFGLADKENSHVTVQLDPGRIARGVLTFPEGTAVPGGIRAVADPRRSYLEPAFRWFVGWTHAESCVGDDGTYEFRGLGAFTYVLKFFLPMEWANPDPILLRLDGRGQDVTECPPIEIMKSVTGTVEVTDPRGAGVCGALIRPYWRGPDGMPRDVRHGHGAIYPPLQVEYFETDGDGRVEIAGLHPQRSYTILVLAPEDREGLYPIETFERWRPTDGVARVAFKSR